MGKRNIGQEIVQGLEESKASRRGAPPHLNLDPEDPNLAEEQRQDLWCADLLGRKSSTLTDLAEEHFLAARHLV